MQRILPLRSLLWLSVAVGLGIGCSSKPVRRTRYEDLVALFRDWRTFQHPKVDAGVPDYSAAAMAAQLRELANYQQRLAAIDTTGWLVPQQVDYRIVGAEMNGLDFDHRVLQPWSRNPAFYVSVFTSQSDQPAREGPVAYGAIELWTYPASLTPDQATELAGRLRAIPGLLRQARNNLTGNARDLWMMGIRAMRQQGADLAEFAARAGAPSDVLAAAQSAREASEQFRAWLEQRLPSKTGPSGIGIENYDWYLRNVQLLPYTWHDEVVLMQRELARAHGFLRLAEHRNRKAAALSPIAGAAEYDRRFHAAVTEYMSFLRTQEILPIRDYMDAALRARIGGYSAARPLEFFNEVNYRDPIVMRTHDYHWFDLGRAVNQPHPSPIRRGPLLYNIFNTRTEGFATGMEEMMMEAGLLDAHPRAKELIYVLLAERAARALGDLMMHANRFTLEESVKWVAGWTPRGWLREDSETDWGEQHLYLQQPGYGTSYVIGKIEVERLIMERARRLGDRFTLSNFMDEFNGVGMIPISLVRWELAGTADEVAGTPPEPERPERP